MQAKALQSLLRPFVTFAKHRPKVVIGHPATLALLRRNAMLSHIIDYKKDVGGVHHCLRLLVISDSSQIGVAFGIKKVVDFCYPSTIASGSSSVTRGLEALVDISVCCDVETVA